LVSTTTRITSAARLGANAVNGRGHSLLGFFVGQIDAFGGCAHVVEERLPLPFPRFEYRNRHDGHDRFAMRLDNHRLAVA
jgi:hypothetical protein